MNFPIKLISALMVIFFLQSCSSSRTNLCHKLSHNINSEVRKEYKVEHGYLFALYDLANIRKVKNINDNHYPSYINDVAANQLFLNKLKTHKRSKNQLENIAKRRIIKIKNLLKSLNAKYKILSTSQVTLVKASFGSGQKNIFDMVGQKKGKKKTNYMDELYNLDKVIEYIPVMLPQVYSKISSHYGMRRHPHKKIKKFHCGIDLITNRNGAIYAAASGTIIKIGHSKDYGKTVDIKHIYGLTTRYSHLKQILVSENSHIMRGQKIGIQGCSGNATGDHLHFEIRINDKHVNPLEFISHACNQ